MPSVPAAVEQAILKALAKKPGARFQDVEAFRAALQAVLQTAPAVLAERPAKTGKALERLRQFIASMAPEKASPGVPKATRLADDAERISVSEAGAVKATRLAGTKETAAAATSEAPVRPPAPLARRLKVADPNPQGIVFAGAGRLVRSIAQMLHNEGFTVELIDTNREHIASARMDGLRTRHANVLSERLYEDIELGGMR